MFVYASERGALSVYGAAFGGSLLSALLLARFSRPTVQQQQLLLCSEEKERPH